MGEKINVAELLKDCPKGMELDCVLYNDITLHEVVLDRAFPIVLKRTNGDTFVTTKYGQYQNTEDAKCVIFPKGKTTWKEFVPPCKYKAGDNKLEKLVEPKFKVGDRIKLKNTPTNNILTVTKTNDDGSLNVNMYSWAITYKLQDEYELVLNNQPKFKVGDKIKKKGDTRLTTIKDVRDGYYIITFPDYFGHCYITDKLSFSNQGDYELTPNKFDITTLKAFDKVLVRDSDKDMWCASIFSHTWKDKYFCTGAWYNQCIPYEANKELLGTTNNPKGHGSN